MRARGPVHEVRDGGGNRFLADRRAHRGQSRPHRPPVVQVRRDHRRDHARRGGHRPPHAGAGPAGPHPSAPPHRPRVHRAARGRAPAPDPGRHRRPARRHGGRARPARRPRRRVRLPAADHRHLANCSACPPPTGTGSATGPTKSSPPPGPTSEKAAVHGLAAYLDALIEDKRRSAADDLLSALLRTSDEDGDRLSASELRAMAYLLLIAGHETTVNLVSNGVQACSRTRSNWRPCAATSGCWTGRSRRCCGTTGRWRPPPSASPASRCPRRHRHPGRQLGAGQPRGRRPGPREVRGTRPLSTSAATRRGHLAFGHGIHFCLGAPWPGWKHGSPSARSWSASPAWRSTPDPSGAPLDWLPGLLMRGVRRLPRQVVKQR